LNEVAKMIDVSEELSAFISGNIFLIILLVILFRVMYNAMRVSFETLKAVVAYTIILRKYNNCYYYINCTPERILKTILWK
jgi:hypothetical protein